MDQQKDFSILEVLDWLTHITFIYKRKAVAVANSTAPDNFFLGEGPHDMIQKRSKQSWMRSEKFWDFIPSRLASSKVNTDNSQIKFICNIKYM